MPDVPVPSLEDLRQQLVEIEDALESDPDPRYLLILRRERREVASAIHYAQEASPPWLAEVFGPKEDPSSFADAIERLVAERDAAVARASELEQQRDEMTDAAQAEQAARHEVESLLDRARAVLAVHASEIDVLRRYDIGLGVRADEWQAARTTGWRTLLRLADLLTPTTEEGEADGR